MRAFVDLAILVSLLFLSACTRNDPTEIKQQTRQSAKNKPAIESSAGQTGKSKSPNELDGAWRLVDVEFGPNIAGEEALKGTTFIVKDSKYTISGPHIHRQGELEIDWTKKLPTMTISEAQATQVGEQIKYGEKIKYHGIVRVEGDKFQMLFTTLEKARPTSFTERNKETTYYSARRTRD